jgi:hypothetical protein
LADFTTWTALLASIRNALANRDLAVGEYRAPDGTFFRYRSIDELIRIEGEIAAKAAQENAATGTATRVSHVKFESRY